MKRTLVQCRRLKSAKHEIKSHSWQIFANLPSMRLLVQCRRLKSAMHEIKSLTWQIFANPPSMRLLVQCRRLSLTLGMICKIYACYIKI